MPHYRVMLEGKNFLLTMDGSPMKLGFITSRFVEAQDEAQAELNAVQLIREAPALAAVLNDRADPPMIYCEGIAEVAPFSAESVSQAGFTFFPDEAKS